VANREKKPLFELFLSLSTELQQLLVTPGESELAAQILD
jgi:hypothetical protein